MCIVDRLLPLRLHDKRDIPFEGSNLVSTLPRQVVSNEAPVAVPAWLIFMSVPKSAAQVRLRR